MTEMVETLPPDVIKLKLIGDDVIDVLKNLSSAILKAQLSNVLPSEDTPVIDTLKDVMDKMKTFKSQMEHVRGANSSFVKARQDHLASIQLNYNELLNKLQSDMERLEMENEQIRSKLSFLDSLSNLDIHSLVDSAKRVALTCHAPSGWDQSSPLWPYRPPYPTEDLIRASLLFSKMSGASEAGLKEENAIAQNIKELGSQSVDQPFDHLIEDADADLLKGLDIASL